MDKSNVSKKYKAVALFLALAMLISLLPVITPEITAEGATNISQTKYSDINDYQNAYMAEIQQAVFDPKTDAGKAQATWAAGDAYGTKAGEEANMADWTVKPNNGYFQWTGGLSGITPWDGVDHSGMTREEIAKEFGWEDGRGLEDRYWEYEYVDESGKDAQDYLEQDEVPPNRFTVLNVEDANHFYLAMLMTEKANDGENILINILSDLDMGGNLGRNWEAMDITNDGTGVNTVYIEGNGHTIYNLKSMQNGLFCTAPSSFVVKNLGFQSVMIIAATSGSGKGGLGHDGAGILCSLNRDGTKSRVTYLYNVHANDAYIQNLDNRYAGGLLGWSGADDTGSGMFIKNCSTSNMIIMGAEHVGGLISNTEFAYGKIEDPQELRFQFDDPMPDDREIMSFIFNKEYYTTVEPFDYPAIVENSYSIDCELFSLGSDSGAFISCGCGIVARNCYTNNNIYADMNTGGFIGRIATDGYQGFMASNVEGSYVASYFENCYSSGVVEGRNAMGGFVGFVETVRGIYTSHQIPSQAPGDAASSRFSSVVFKNCYSTSSVGMDYSGRYCGGFVGLDEGYAIGTEVDFGDGPVKFNGTAYVNCYAAGEVGNILTVTDIEKAKRDELLYLREYAGVDNKQGDTVEVLAYYPTGGFIGVLCPDRWWVELGEHYDNPPYPGFAPNHGSAWPDFWAEEAYGYFNNCYYDMQTTAMREMEIGMAGGTYTPLPQYTDDYEGESFIFKTYDKEGHTVLMEDFNVDGITGVYTLKSEIKDVDGLASSGSVQMGEASDWHYEEGYYPQLQVFRTSPAETFNGSVPDDEIKDSVFYIKEQEDPGTVTQEYKMSSLSDDDVQQGIMTEQRDDDDMRLENATGQSDDDDMEPENETEQSGDDDMESEIVTEQSDDDDTQSEIVTEQSGDDDTQSEIMMMQGGDMDPEVMPMQGDDMEPEIVTKQGVRSCVVNTCDNASMVMKTYRCSQASAAAVMLEHYDLIMQADGSLSGDGDWMVADPHNKMVYNEQSGYYEVHYEKVNAGRYEFKVQANNSMTYNYGKSKFDDPENCVLVVTENGTDITIRFKYETLFSSNYQIYADFSTPSGKKYTECVGGNDKAEVWQLVGSFNSWPETGDDRSGAYDMVPNAVDPNIYELTLPIEPNKDDEGNIIAHEFKVRKDYSWAVNYGWNGTSGGGNMSFIVDKTCNITFQFDSKTKLFKLSADPVDALISVDTYDDTDYHYDGFTIISDKQSLTGKRWNPAGTVGEKAEAAEAGVMTKLDDGTYKAVFENVPTDMNYPYRIVSYDSENGAVLDEGINNYFHIVGDSGDSCTVTITYDPAAGENTVSAKKAGANKELAEEGLVADFYAVGGDVGLTGLHWLGSDPQNLPNSLPGETQEQYIQRAIEVGTMKRLTQSLNQSLYQIILPKVPAGTHVFKVFADGDIDCGFGLNGGSENYSFTLDKEADVTITFNADKQMISVRCGVEGALETETYVVTGTENLMGVAWNFYNAIMTYDDEKALFEYVISDAAGNPKEIPADNNYSYKVIKRGEDSGENQSFYLNNDRADSYYIKVSYDSKTGNSFIEVYSDPALKNNVTEQVREEVHISSYSVLGDKGLTNYTWLGLQDNGQPYTGEDRTRMESAASLAGRMEFHENGEYAGKYVKKYDGISVGYGSPNSYAFKVAANGNWDSGISYGNGNDNYILNLLSSDQAIYQCSVTIIFDPETSKIEIETNPSGLETGSIDTKDFTWYLVGDQRIASFENLFTASETVYDTVRDITQPFTFTSGYESTDKGITWAINKKQNERDGFFDRFGGGGFTLDYTIDGRKEAATFNEEIVELTGVASSEGVKDIEYNEDGSIKSYPENANNYAGSVITYTSDRFMPGKQYLTISAYGIGYCETYNEWKRKYLRYTLYQEKKKELEDNAEKIFLLIDDLNYTLDDLYGFFIDAKNVERDDGQSQYEFLIDKYLDGYDYNTKYDQFKELESNTEYTTDPGPAPDRDEHYVGTRTIRLIPQAYLEAGNDAVISIIEDQNDGEEGLGLQNIVMYEENESPDVKVSGIDKSFSYYNLAFSAGYAITDKIGLGIYDNYSNQDKGGDYGVIKYNESKKRDQDDLNKRETGTYYAMTSVFTQASEYQDTGKGYATNIDQGLLLQSLIGDTYRTSTVGDNDLVGKTVLKLYQYSLDENGKKTYNDDGSERKIKLEVDKNASDQNSEAYQNYLKWSTQKKFDEHDAGLYRVEFYWAMHDGRYLFDYKDVRIEPATADITKAVDKIVDESGNNEITYTLKYTNIVTSGAATFAILDILPFSEDERISKDPDILNQHTTLANSQREIGYTVESIEITTESPTNAQKAHINGVYITDNPVVRKLMTDNGGKPDVSAAGKLNVSVAPSDVIEIPEIEASQFGKIDTNQTIDGESVEWKEITEAGQYAPFEHKYTFDPGTNIIAVAVSGVQLAAAETVIIEIKLKYTGETNDAYVNNVYRYTAYGATWDSNNQKVKDGYGESNAVSDYVTTTIVGRELKGSVWLDENINGHLDRGEPLIEGVQVDLLKFDADGNNPQTVGSTETDENGAYSFGSDKLREGTYRVVFTEPSGGNVKIDGEEVPYSSLGLSKRFAEVSGEDNNIADIYEPDERSVSKSYSILEKKMPSKEEIYANTYLREANVRKVGYVYEKSRQDLALVSLNSLTIHKYSDGDSEEPLEGIVFRMEYLDGNGDWQPLIYKANGYMDTEHEVTGGTNEFPTDASGEISLQNLLPTKYRITEVSTDEDNNPLIMPIEIELPFDHTQGDSHGIVTSPSETDGTGAYADVVITLSNTTKLSDYLPYTGAAQALKYWIPIIGFLLVVAGAGVIVYAVRRKNTAKKL